MKKLFTTIIVLLLTVTVNVFAEDYNILVDENNNFTLKDSSNNQVVDETIAKYENNTLTLGENTTFNEIKTKHDLTITSNNKEVSIKNLTTKEGNTYLPVNVNINKLKVKDDETYYFKIVVGGNLIINNSELNSKEVYDIKGYTYFTDSKITNTKSINLSGKNDEGYGFIITNSTVKSGGQIYPQIGGTYIKDSKIEAYYLYSRGYFYIEESSINCNYFTQQDNTSETYIKNSTIKVNKAEQNYGSANSSGLLTLEDSEFEACSLVLRKKGIKMINSKLHLVITDGAYDSGALSSEGNIEINNSILNAEKSISLWNEATDYNGIMFNNSEIETGYILTSINQDNNYLVLDAKNSKITLTKNTTIFRGNMRFENCELNFQKYVFAYNSISIINSKGLFTGIIIIDNNLTIKESTLLFNNTTGTSENYAPLVVKKDLIINDSNVVIDNTSNNRKPVFIQGKVVLDDRIIPIDNVKEKLKIKEIEDSTEERATCTTCFINDKPIYAFAYDNDSYTEYVKLATTKTISFRVKNGTWLDGTTDDIKLDYLYGEKIDVENLPEEVKKLLTSKMGEWSVDLYNLDPTKDQEIEFKYNIVNPETARNYIIMLFTILAVVIFLKKKKTVNT